MFSEYEVFELVNSVQDDSVPTGSRGVVLMVFEGDVVSYEVEFPDGEGGNLGNEVTYTITESQMKRVNPERSM
jgi:hypothetical protein